MPPMEDLFRNLKLDLGRIHDDTAAVVAGILVLLLAFFLSALGRRFIDGLCAQGHLQAAMAGRLHLARRWMFSLLTPLVLLQATGMIQHAWTVISAGMAAVAIGFFATWSLLSNATSALLLLTFRPFRVGDLVDVVEPSNGSQLSGRVVDMNLMFTTLREHTGGNHRATGTLHVPNSLFFQKMIRIAHTMPQDASTPFFAASQAPPVQPPAKHKKSAD